MRARFILSETWANLTRNLSMLLSLTLVTCFLPALLVLLDRVIRRTTWHANFAPVAAAEPAVPAASEGVDAASPVAAEGSEPAPLPASEGDES